MQSLGVFLFLQLFSAHSRRINQNKIANQFDIRCPARLILNLLIQSYRINKNSVITTERINKTISAKDLHDLFCF